MEANGKSIIGKLLRMFFIHVVFVFVYFGVLKLLYINYPREDKFLVKATPESEYYGPIGNCTAPLKYICQSQKDALTCNAAPYCIQCVWSTAFLPSDIIGLKCQQCQASVESAKATLHWDVEDYAAALFNICHLHIQIEDKAVCTQNIHQYLTNKNVFWAVDAFQFSNLDTCAFLGMCYSPFVVKLESEAAARTLEELHPTLWKPVKNFIFNSELLKIEETRVNNPFLDAIFDFTNFRKFYPIFNTKETSGKFSKYSCQFAEFGASTKLSPVLSQLIFFIVCGIPVYIYTYLQLKRKEKEEAHKIIGKNLILRNRNIAESNVQLV